MPTSPVLDQFVATCGQAATRLGIQHVVIVARDPQTGEIRFVASPGAKDEFHGFVADKLGLDGGSDTGWG
jgi:hypothetical protein